MPVAAHLDVRPASDAAQHELARRRCCVLLCVSSAGCVRRRAAVPPRGEDESRRQRRCRRARGEPRAARSAADVRRARAVPPRGCSSRQLVVGSARRTRRRRSRRRARDTRRTCAGNRARTCRPGRLEVLLLEGADVLRADLRRELDLGVAESLPLARLSEAVADLEHGRSLAAQCARGARATRRVPLRSRRRA